ncbi:hypothetical protein HH214_08015 [Mucilaginibacter robiniae]|uniref:Entericidin n=1 Tax=Mucilaginibacter robiniae TaxID=2728022 RepID=A0A7L5DXJ2_9SPHI|nr:hypothetical protein [Mucilaginibacter robiniae]QJD95820.1 hypothetical protein HH214_08015 [Mucilaginibacter robiniae]
MKKLAFILLAAAGVSLASCKGNNTSQGAGTGDSATVSDSSMKNLDPSGTGVKADGTATGLSDTTKK